MQECPLCESPLEEVEYTNDFFCPSKGHSTSTSTETRCSNDSCDYHNEPIDRENL